MKYKIGQILTSKEDVEVEKALSGETFYILPTIIIRKFKKEVSIEFHFLKLHAGLLFGK